MQEVIAVFRCIAHDCKHQRLVPEIESGSESSKLKSSYLTISAKEDMIIYGTDPPPTFTQIASLLVTCQEKLSPYCITYVILQHI